MQNESQHKYRKWLTGRVFNFWYSYTFLGIIVKLVWTVTENNTDNHSYHQHFHVLLTSHDLCYKIQILFIFW